MIFSFYQREFNPSWSILQIEKLLRIAIENNSSTFITYAALESRINIERIEFEILVMTAHNSLDSEWQDIIGEYNGIQKVNAKYKALKYRYQTFTEAFSKSVVDDLSIKPFDFKQAEELQSRLSQYIHIYTRKPSEILFESEFIQNGVALIKETISFFDNMFSIHEGAYIYGILDFHSLKHGFEIEFKNWVKSKDEDVESLTFRLKRIVDNYID